MLVSNGTRRSRIEFRILGPLEVYDEKRPLALGGRQQRALLALLLLHANEPVPVARIIDELWPDAPPPSATKSVQALASRLRRTLEAEPSARNGDARGNGVVLTRAHGYVLTIAPGELDLDRFESLLEAGRGALAAGRAEQASATLREALALWRGPPLAEFASDSFAGADIARLNELRLAALEDRLEADLAVGRSAELVAELESLVAAHPLRERLRGQLMLALYRCGRQAEALKVYQDTRRQLDDDLGLEPGQALRRLEQAILRQDASLDASVPVVREGQRPLRRLVTLAGVTGVLVTAAILTAYLATRKDSSPSVNVLGNSVAVIDPSANRVERQIAVGARPAFVSYGDQGVWVANLDDNSVSRVDRRTNRVVRTIATDASPAGLAVAAGSIWVANSDVATVSRIDPRYNRPVETIPVDGPTGWGVSAIASGLGSVWVAHRGGTVSRINPERRRVVARIVVGNEPRALAVGEGAVWVANAWWDGTVSRIDLANAETAKIPVGPGAAAVAAGAGAVWVANALDDTVVRIDPATNAIEATIPVGKRPGGIAAGTRSVWVTGSGDGTISKIDPRTNKVVRTIRVGSSPSGVVLSAGTVWVTVQDSVTVSGELPAGKAGGLARFNIEDGFDFTDPAVAYYTTSWQLGYATGAKLLNYPDRPAPAGSRLVPEVAQSLPVVSGDGKRYTFTIRDGYTFSPPSNERVTAQTFKYSIERSLSPKLRLAAQFAGDIVGVGAYRQGRAKHISGVVVRGDKLTIQLTRAARHFPSVLAMPFFSAVPIGTPVDPNGLRAIPSAGPYYVASYTPKRQIVVRRNPNYRGPRPHRLEEIVYTLGVGKARTVAQIEAGKVDYAADGVPPSASSRLAADYGKGSAAKAGRQRYFVEPLLGVSYLALNTSRPLFADVELRKAVNYAIDRPALARQRSATTFDLGEPTDQYLPPGIPGFKDVHIYPLNGPDVKTARNLASGKGGTAVLYTCDVPPCPQQAEVVRANLKKIGIDVDIKKFPFGVLFDKMSTRGEPFDLVLSGWVVDYADPHNIFDNLLDGTNIKARDNNNVAYFDDPTYNRKLAAAASRAGPQRYRTYAALDLELARDAAPLVAIATPTNRHFFSARIGCHIAQPVYGFDLAALCLRRGSD